MSILPGLVGVIATIVAAVSPPVNTVAGTATGSTYAGSSIFMNPGTWTGSPTFTYQVRKNGVNFGSPQVSQYFAFASDGSDTGVAITFIPIGTNAGGTVPGTESNAITPIATTYTVLQPNPDPQGDYVFFDSGLRANCPGGSVFTSIIHCAEAFAGGSFYVECELVAGDPVTGAIALGIARTAVLDGSVFSPTFNKAGFAEYILSGARRLDGASAGADVATATIGDIIGLTMDIPNNQFKVRKNNTLLYTGTLPVGAAGNYAFYACNENCSGTVNFKFKVAPATLTYLATAAVDHATPGSPSN